MKGIGIAGLFCIGLILLGLNFYPFHGTHTPTVAKLGNLELIPPTKNAESSATVDSAKTVKPEAISEMVAEADPTQAGMEEFFLNKPNSMLDVPAPENLGVDQAGELIVDLRVRALFDHYLNAVGEESLENIILRIRHALRGQLTGVALDASIALLEGYLQYKNHIGLLKNDFAQNHSGGAYDLEAVRQMKEEVLASRHSFFTESTIAGMFEREDQYDDYMMARELISTNDGLSLDEKQSQLSNIEASAPQWIHSETESSNRLTLYRASETELRGSGGSDYEVQLLRETTYGPEVAERLRIVDEERLEWRNQMGLYRTELNSILAGGDLSELDPGFLQELREAHFSGAELARVDALDRIELNSD